MSLRVLLTCLQGPRGQMDRTLYRKNMQDTLLGYKNLDVRAGSVFDLIFDHTQPSTSQNVWGQVEGVRLGMRYLSVFII